MNFRVIELNQGNRFRLSQLLPFMPEDHTGRLKTLDYLEIQATQTAFYAKIEGMDYFIRSNSTLRMDMSYSNIFNDNTQVFENTLISMTNVPSSIAIECFCKHTKHTLDR